MKLSYLQAGEGQDLVMLHGYLSSKESFYPQIDYFSKFYRVTALDFPGFGGAEPIPFAYSVSDYADWTEEALFFLGIRSPRVFAHSFGG
ncbi:MAG: alpha/beta hydrolase, partial [Clostridia bacterium]|nr:alpha/beta hydrolase [Clostridia bacterium]